MNITDLRLKIRHFFRKNIKYIFIFVIAWLIVFFVNQLLKIPQEKPTATTTFTPQETVIDNIRISTSEHNKIEETIKQFVEYCNNNEFDKAYNMLSADCRKYGYKNDFAEFQQHILSMMPEPREYNIQAYSNPETNIYVYKVNYIPDYLSTGMTNQNYKYATEKMTFKKVGNGYEMSVGDFYNAEDISSVGQNDYIRIEVLDKIVKYEKEIYKIRIKNRSDEIAVIYDGTEPDELTLKLNNDEDRKTDYSQVIVLAKGEEYEYELEFPKYVDDNKISQTLCFNDVRIMRDYYGPSATEEEIANAKVNALAKFSLRINVVKN